MIGFKFCRCVAILSEFHIESTVHSELIVSKVCIAIGRGRDDYVDPVLAVVTFWW